MKRRVLIGGAMAAGVAAGLPLTSSAEEKAGKAVRAVAKVDDGSVVNVPLAKRSGPKSVVYFTRDLSADGLRKIVAKVSSVLTGKVAVKPTRLISALPSIPRFLPGKNSTMS